MRRQLHLESQVRELVDQAFRTSGRIKALEVVRAEFRIGLAPRDNVVDDHEERMGQGYGRFLLSTPGGDASVARLRMGQNTIQHLLRSTTCRLPAQRLGRSTLLTTLEPYLCDR